MMERRAPRCLPATVAIIFVLAALGCERAAEQTPGPGAKGMIVAVYTPSGGRVDLVESEIRSMREMSGDADGINVAGHSISVPYAGHELEVVLERVGVARSDLGGIRLVSRDGYSIELSRDMLMERSVILAHRMYGDGELKDEDRPFRVVVPGERTMFWTRGLTEIHLLSRNDPHSTKTLVLIAEGINSPGGRLDLVQLLGDAAATVTIVASDGMEKREALDPARRYYVDFDDEERAPFFNSPDHQRGMNIRQVAAVLHGDKAYIFLAGFAAAEGAIPGEAVLDLLGESSAERLVLVAGSREIEVSAADLASGDIEVVGGSAVFRVR